MSRVSLRVLSAFTTVALVSVPAASRAGDWLPLVIGNRWEYQTAGGTHQVETIIGFTIVRGRTVAMKSYTVGPDAGLENYWLLDTDGSVLLAGFNNPGQGTAWAYEPPIRYLPVPPAVGPQPEQTIAVHDILTDNVIFTGSFRYDVTEHTALNEPAGSFDTFGVGRLIPLPGPALGGRPSLTLDGRHVPAQPPGIYTISTTDWYAEGVGVVQYSTGDLFQLVSYPNPSPVPTLATSWGAIKRLYH